MRCTRRAKRIDAFRETDIKTSRRVSDTKHESLLTAWAQKPCPPYLLSFGDAQIRLERI
jgi:hypothetical protein